MSCSAEAEKCIVKSHFSNYDRGLHSLGFEEVKKATCKSQDMRNVLTEKSDETGCRSWGLFSFYCKESLDAEVCMVVALSYCFHSFEFLACEWALVGR